MSLSQDQIEERRQYITASEIAAVCGVGKYQTRHDIWLRKIGKETPQESTLMMDIGSELQKPFLEVMNKHLVLNFENNDEDILWKHTLLPHCAATPDGLEWYTDNNGEPVLTRIAEVKFVGPNTAQDWDRSEDGIPGHVMCQIQWQMACCDVDECIVMALVWGAPRHYVIKFNKELFEAMYERAIEFWADHVETGIPSYQETVPLELPQRTRDIIDVDIEAYGLHDACRTYATANLNLANAKLARALAQSKIIEAIGDHAGLRFGDMVFTHKANKMGKRRFLFKREISR